MAETKKTETKTVKSSETKAAAAKAPAKKTTTTKTATTKTTTKAAATKKVAEAKVEAPVAEVKAETAPAKVAAKAEKKVAAGMLQVTLVKSPYGRLENQTRTLKALGLKKTNSSNIVPDNAATRGMIFVVKHLVSVEIVK